jgi:ATP-binding cassette subfamily C protein CydD
MDKRLVREALAHKGLLAGTIGFSLLAAALVLFQSWQVAWIVNAIFLDHAGRRWLTGALGLAALAVVLRLACETGSDFFGLRLAESIQGDMRRRLVRTLAGLAYNDRHSLLKGQVLGLLYDGIEKLAPFYSGYLPQMARAVAVPVLFLAVVFPLDWISGLIMVLTLPLIPVFMMLIGTWTKRASERQWQSLMRFSAFLEDVLRGLETLVSLGRSKEEGSRIAQVSDNYRLATFRVQRWAFLSSMALELVATLSIALVAVGLGIRLSAGTFTFLPAFYILLLAPDYYEPMRTLGRYFHDGINAREAADSLYDFFYRTGQAQKEEGEILDQIKTIEFRHVTYRYPRTERDAVQDVSFSYDVRDRVAFVGASGSGKSTLMLLALGLLTPTGGQVLVNGRPLADWRAADRRREMAAVLQTGTLFAGTVAQNITFAPAPDDQACRRAAAIASQVGLDRLFEGESGLMDRPIEEGAANISGGQRALILLARALYHQGSVFFLDEMTDNLDLASEKVLSQRLPDLLRQRGAWMIAHRLGTLRTADCIHVMREGRLVATGTYDQVVDAAGHFRES